MGFLKSLISGAIEDGVRKVVGEATEKAFAPTAERIANKAAADFEVVANAASATAANAAEEAVEIANSEILLRFPAWTFSDVKDINKDETDEYVLERITVDLTDDAVEAYQKVLRANGYEGDWQIMKKVVNGKEQMVDFTFVCDSEIQYVIRK